VWWSKNTYSYQKAKIKKNKEGFGSHNTLQGHDPKNLKMPQQPSLLKVSKISQYCHPNSNLPHSQ
jgi:hypothetical protein